MGHVGELYHRVECTKGRLGTHGSRRVLERGSHFHSTVPFYSEGYKMIDYLRVGRCTVSLPSTPTLPVSLHPTQSLMRMTSHDIECFNFVPIPVMHHEVIIGFR
jgi:hypothetical protein